jgi:hypothetical protein
LTFNSLHLRDLSSSCDSSVGSIAQSSISRRRAFEFATPPVLVAHLPRHPSKQAFHLLLAALVMASASEHDIMETGELEDDLFGSGSEDGAVETKVRELSDRELDSGDDEDRDDRAPENADAEEVDYDSGRDARVLDSTVWRHPLPKPFDEEVD